MAKMDYRKVRSQSGNSYRWSAPAVNTGLGPKKSLKTPEQMKVIRRQFLINCVRAEMRGESYPGVPRAMRRSDVLLKGNVQELIRMWIVQQPDVAEAIDRVREKDASRGKPHAR